MLEIDAPAQFKALAHPLRQRLLFHLGRAPATISALAGALETGKGNISHHLGVLRDAGLVTVTATRRVRGGTEHHYGRTARHLVVAEHRPGPSGAMLGAVAEELTRSPEEPLLALRHLRLTDAQAAGLRSALERLVQETEEAGEEEAVHGVLVALYREA
ncbi:MULTISPECIES: transcriptional regulator [Streptomyces]|uniref:ArsR/SmtB family transcription factor n=1 Tax=Streptomyces TaxID=1883 RepID=UPI001D131C39|nr:MULTISPECIES: helix-turn-helix domain-containing protein [Streptomyces]